MSSAPRPEEIARDPAWLAQGYDRGHVRLVAMSEADYRDAAFLDDRMFIAPRTTIVTPLAPMLASLDPSLRSDARWIFHIGHVGSTLIARLLGELPGVLSIREPRFLRDLAALPSKQREGLLDPARRLFSRTFRAEQVALVKTSSWLSDIAPELCPPAGRAMMLTVGAPTYLRTILAGPASRRELNARAAERQQRLARRVPSLIPPFPTEALLVAAAWAAEATSIEAAADAMTDRELLWLDFDRFLTDPAGELGRIATHFGFPSTADTISAIASGPLIGRYSKATEFEYSPDLRRQLLDQAQHQHGAEIADALAMLDRAAQDSPLLARALERTAES